MPASGKMLKKRLQKSNREAGIGDENGRLPSKVIAVATMAQCTICLSSIRSSKTNTEMKAHRENKHPTSTFAICFPSFFNPDLAPVAEVVVKDEVVVVKDEVVADVPVVEKLKKEKKPKADLSFLDSAILPTKKK